MDLENGDLLITDIFNSYGLLVLSGGVLLDADSISKLFQHNIDYVDIAPRLKDSSATPSPTVSQLYALQELTKTFRTTVSETKNMFTMAAEHGMVDETAVDSTFRPLVDQFRRQTDVASLLLLINAKDDYTYRHSLQVGMIAFYIAKWMGKSEADCLLAGKAGYLHDIGKSKIPEEILNKPGKLTEEEFAEIRRHPVYGFDIINESLGNPHLALPALQHHERFDGSGYPHGIKEQDMHPLSSIIAVADIYSAMISTRVYQKQKDLLNVLYELYRLSFGQIDPHITQIFIRNMLPNMIGKQVVLNTGAVGKIVMTNPTDSFRPLVQVDDNFIDLSLINNICIEKILTA
jgi:putative nucleotidyltransferase with HDIG domain